MAWAAKRRVEVLGHEMAYVDMGQGQPVVLLHGNPTSSYLWRDVVPPIAQGARCIVPDLIGFGDSDKPDIPYRVTDHQRYLEHFLQALDLGQVVLVLHDWGSALGFDWARRHEGQVRGLAFMEFIWPMPTWLDFGERAAPMFQAFRDPKEGRRLLIEENAFIERVLPNSVARGLTEEEMAEYRRPFLSPEYREPVWRFPNELPIAGHPADAYALVTAYHEWLLETDLPKLFFWATPGALVTIERARWYARRLKACRSVELGVGVHYVQEDHGEVIGREIAEWLSELSEA